MHKKDDATLTSQSPWPVAPLSSNGSKQRPRARQSIGSIYFDGRSQVSKKRKKRSDYAGERRTNCGFLASLQGVEVYSSECMNVYRQIFPGLGDGSDARHDCKI